MITNEHKRILIAPLDWGLGHTTRCIPLMLHLQQLKCQVVFAGNDWQRQYIRKALNGIETIDVPGYDIRYSKTGNGLKWSLLLQVPRIMKTILHEHEWLEHAVKEHAIDGIISDNRYGLHHTSLPSVIITHQLQVQTGMGSTADNVVRKLHYKYLNNFNECWVVDVPGVPNLSGKLAHPEVLPCHAKYVGLLSQIEQAQVSTEGHLLILLSGPEPQRSILSDILWPQAVAHKGAVTFIEGSSSKVRRHDQVPAHIRHYLQLTREELEPLMRQASIIICRSGYSTLMDLVALGKKAIVIPTPGQTEQEYLGKHLHEQGVFYRHEQNSFDLSRALAKADGFPFRSLVLHGAHQQFIPVLDNWVASL